MMLVSSTDCECVSWALGGDIAYSDEGIQMPELDGSGSNPCLTRLAESAGRERTLPALPFLYRILNPAAGLATLEAFARNLHYQGRIDEDQFQRALALMEQHLSRLAQMAEDLQSIDLEDLQECILEFDAEPDLCVDED